MSEPPRRQRANAWVWAYLVLFESDENKKEKTEDSTPNKENSDTNDRQPTEK
jgi:hypothetical protein